MSSCKKGKEACADLSMLAATEEDYAPFGAMPSDGIVGLGLEGLAVGALSSFFPRLLDGSQHMLPEIGFALGSDGGEIIFGGRSPTATLASPHERFPVSHPEDGFWQVEVLSVRADGIIIDTCEGGCKAIIDTASSHLGVQANRLARVGTFIKPADNSDGCVGPKLQFELKSGFALNLHVEDYIGPKCTAEFGSLALDEPAFKGVYSFGTNVLRRYYAAFDWSQTRIGFAPKIASDTLHMDRDSAPAEAQITI
jgi:hypothetical protein